MKNIDRWFILIGLLYGIFGFGFGIWVGINQDGLALPNNPERESRKIL